MPRVVTKTKSARGATYNCTKCGNPIEPGQTFHQWAFRYGGKRFRHTECGYPRPSELTQSRMGDVLAALESVQDMVDGDPTGWTIEDAAGALDEAAQVAQEIADEARSTADEHFGGGGPHAERADEMEEHVSTLEQAASEVRDIDEPEESTDDGPEHELVVTEDEEGRVMVECVVCAVSVNGNTNEPSWPVARAEFEEAHPIDYVDGEDEDDGDPWFEQVRSIVQDVSI